MTMVLPDGVYASEEKMPAHPHDIPRDEAMWAPRLRGELRHAAGIFLAEAQRVEVWVGLSHSRILTILGQKILAHEEGERIAVEQHRKYLDTVRAQQVLNICTLGVTSFFLRKPVAPLFPKVVPRSPTASDLTQRTLIGFNALIRGRYATAHGSGERRIYFPTPKLVRRLLPRDQGGSRTAEFLPSTVK